jgi:hypothetical protein
MRHQSIRQTDGYTDESQLPIYEAIKALPLLLGYTNTRADFRRKRSKLGATWRSE